MTISLAISALQRFIQKRTPDNIAPPKSGDEKLGDGLLKPGVFDNQSVVVRWLSEDSGLGIIPEEALTQLVNFEEILSYLRSHDIYRLATSKSSDSFTVGEDRQLQSFFFDDTDVRIVLALCRLKELQSFVSGFNLDLQREILLTTGHYEAAKSLDGWDTFANQPYHGLDSSQRRPGPIPISNGDAYGLCQRFERGGTTGNSPAIVRIYLDIAQIAAIVNSTSPAPIVLIQGSHGSGKGLLAQTLAALSNRTNPLLRINLSALAPELIESELYGHVKGAFTGSTQDRKGYFEECKGGGLVVLDDINHMETRQLYKLLQCFEERTVTRVGSTKPIDISNCMIVVTSNEDLKAFGESGQARAGEGQKSQTEANEILTDEASQASRSFPPDVLERISGHVVQLPELAYRRRDIPLLVRHFLGNEETNPLSPFRFHIARKIELWANDLPQLSIRSIRNEIMGLRRESQDIGDILADKDVYQTRILSAIKKLYPNGEQIVKSQVAEELGISRSGLSETSNPYGRAFKQLKEDEEIS